MHWWKLLERPEMFEIWEDVDLTDRYEDVKKFTKEEAEGVPVTKKLVIITFHTKIFMEWNTYLLNLLCTCSR